MDNNITYSSNDRYHKIAKCMDLWMTLREEEIKITDFFQRCGFHKIGIYGYGILGRHLIWEIDQMRGPEISWILDKRARTIKTEKQAVYLPEEFEEIEDVDAVVVCVIDEYEQIEAYLCEKKRIKVFSLEQIIKESYGKTR